MSVSWCSGRLMEIQIYFQNRSEIIFGGSSLFMAEYVESKSNNVYRQQKFSLVIVQLPVGPCFNHPREADICSESNDQRILKQKI